MIKPKTYQQILLGKLNDSMNTRMSLRLTDYDQGMQDALNLYNKWEKDNS